MLFGEEYSFFHIAETGNFWNELIYGTQLKEEKQQLQNAVIENLKTKIPFLYATYDIIDNLKIGLVEEVEPPEFKLSIQKWGITNVKIIDFTPYEPYRIFIKNIIRAIAWFYFIKRTMRKMPSIVY